jgi:hypothetical protein
MADHGMTWHLWGKYLTFRDAYRNKAFHEQTEDTTLKWRVERDKSVIRGWLLQYKRWGEE